MSSSRLYDQKYLQVTKCLEYMSKNSIVTQKKPPVQPRAPLLILKHKEIEAKQVKTQLEWYVSQQDVTVKYLLILSLY